MSILAKFTVLLIALSAFFVGPGLCQDATECKLGGSNITAEEWKNGLVKIEIEDQTTAVPFNLRTIKLDSNQTAEVEVEIVGGARAVASEYLEIGGDDKNGYSVRLHDGFYKKFEEQEASTNVKINVIITCAVDSKPVSAGPKTILFDLTIKDFNNHEPKFDLPDSEKGEYTFKLPMPVPAGFDFSPYNKIIVRDADLTNENISLALDSENKEVLESLKIASAGKDPSDVLHKRHLVDFTALKSFELNESVTFNLTAKDSGTKDDPKTLKETTTKLTFVVDQDNSYPKFNQTLYTADISKVNKTQIQNKDLTEFLDQQIILNLGNLTNLNVTVEAVPDLAFIATVDAATRQVKILMTKTSPDQNVFLQKYVLLKLKATDGKFRSAESLLKITLPDADSETPVVEDDGKVSDGYRVATIILSLIIVGLMIYIIYPLVKHIRLDFWNR